MSFWEFLTGKSAPSAKVCDGRFVLSLPDAQTPVIWVMDLAEAATSVLRLETDRQGFFVIRRHSGKSAAEAVAVYRDRAGADRAMKVAARALERARSAHLHAGPNGAPVIIRPASRLGRAFTVFLFVWFVLHITGLERMLLSIAYFKLNQGETVTLAPSSAGGAGSAAPAAAAPAAAVPAVPSPVAPSTDERQPGDLRGKVGVPISADDLLGDEPAQ